eukprot:204599-Rhodomonas_salina.2
MLFFCPRVCMRRATMMRSERECVFVVVRLLEKEKSQGKPMCTYFAPCVFALHTVCVCTAHRGPHCTHGECLSQYCTRRFAHGACTRTLHTARALALHTAAHGSAMRGTRVCAGGRRDGRRRGLPPRAPGLAPLFI